MFQLTSLEPVDYLVIGHLTRDITPEGPRLGGTVAYSALTARALGLRVGVVTSWGADLPLGPMRSVPIASFPADETTTFENVATPAGRVQHIRAVAPRLDYYHVPEPWRAAPIVHLGPVAQEVEPSLVRNFPAALLGATPQGWMRTWDSSGRVWPTDWVEASFVLQQAGVTILSTEDVEGDETRIEEMAAYSPILVVTEGSQGARVYWNGDVRRFPAPQVKVVDDTGAGDVFAASFLVRMYHTRDPWEAARFATQMAAISVTRQGLSGIPTEDEINQHLVEVY